MSSDRAALQLVQQIGQIENRRRTIIMREKEVSTRLDVLRQEQVAKMSQLRHTEDRISSLRSAVHSLELSSSSSKDFAADAATRVEKARIEEPVLLRVATDSRDASKEELERWQKGVEGAEAASATWGVEEKSKDEQKQKNNNQNQEASEETSLTENNDAASPSSRKIHQTQTNGSKATFQDCAAASSSSVDGDAPATSSASKFLQKEITRLDASISASQQNEALCRAKVAKLAQETLDLRAAIKEMSDCIASLSFSSTSSDFKNELMDSSGGKNKNHSTTSSTGKNLHQDGDAAAAGGGEHQAARTVERLRREIEEADARHRRQMQQPQREVDTLLGRIQELTGWADDTKMQAAAARSAVEELSLRKASGLCAVCAGEGTV